MTGRYSGSEESEGISDERWVGGRMKRMEIKSEEGRFIIEWVEANGAKLAFII
jgi:hypothetical protein